MDAVTQVPVPVNEPVHSYAPGSPERFRLEAKLKEEREARNRDRAVARQRILDSERVNQELTGELARERRKAGGAGGGGGG